MGDECLDYDAFARKDTFLRKRRRVLGRERNDAVEGMMDVFTCLC